MEILLKLVLIFALLSLTGIMLIILGFVIKGILLLFGIDFDFADKLVDIGIPLSILSFGGSLLSAGIIVVGYLWYKIF